VFRKSLVLHGEEFYVDGWRVSFDRELVEVGDALRGKSMFMFRRAFGSADQPDHGPALTAPEVIPPEFKVDPKPTQFERDIWSHFWQLANDPSSANKWRVSTAQGEAPYTKPIAGQIYKVSLRNAGGVDIKPIIRAPALKR